MSKVEIARRTLEEQMLLDLEELLIRRARTDFLSYLIATSDERKPYQVNWHHRILADKLNKFVSGEIPYLMVFMPPRHGKSEEVSRGLPAFIHGHYPDAEIFAVSYLDSLATDMCTAVQERLESPAHKRIFPEVGIHVQGVKYSIGTRNSSEHNIVNPKTMRNYRGVYRAAGVGGSFTGKGANFIIIDDPIKGRDAADSETFRERLWNFWKADLYTRLETDLSTGRKGQVLVTLTRWHEDDLAGRLLAQMKDDPSSIQWDIIDFPAIKENNDNPLDPRQIGEALWPEKYNLKQLENIRTTIGVRDWGALYQQHPTPEGGALFNENMFDFVELPSDFDYEFITADTAYKEKQENDFNVFSHWGVIKDQLFLIDLIKKQLKSSDVEKWCRPFIERAMKYGYRNTWIEPKGHGIYLNQKFMELGLGIPGESEMKEFYKDRRFDKVERANNVLPHLATRRVHINQNISIKEDLVLEALNFPKVSHDDFVDTLIDALKITYGKAASLLDVL